MARKSQENPALDMTPMIDVVFELIIFFVVNIKQEDIISQLNANRPAAPEGPAQETSDNTVTIQIGKAMSGKKAENGRIAYNGAEIDIPKLNEFLSKLPSKDTPIIVRCTGDSPHKALIDVLDVCYGNKLYSVSIFSMIDK